MYDESYNVVEGSDEAVGIAVKVRLYFLCVRETLIRLPPSNLLKSFSQIKSVIVPNTTEYY